MKNKQFTRDEQTILKQIMQHRRDIRGNNFLTDSLSDESINQILDAASLAPSVGFSQPWEFVVIHDPLIKQQIAESFKIENKKAQAIFSTEKQTDYATLKLEGILEAPVNIAVFYQRSKMPVLGQNSMQEMGPYSVVCAVQNMWLMSRALNIGLGWVSILDPKKVKQILKAPIDNQLVAYLCLGYVKEFFSSPELEHLNWEKRKKINSVVYRDQYSS
jgi:5,6-dimethylbenzimidazole synthase